MMRIYYPILLILSLLYSIPVSSEAKRSLGHDDFDGWQSVKNNAISRDGRWQAFSVVPQEGDAVLTLRDTRKGTRIEIERGYNPTFSADGRYAVLLVKPHHADTRQAKIDKKKDFDMPQDSLAIVELSTGHIEKIPNIINYKIGEKGGHWLAYQTCDTLYIRPELLKDKDAGRPLVVRDLLSPASKVVKHVGDYAISKNGARLTLTTKKSEKDSLSAAGVAVVELADMSLTLVDRDKKHYNTPVFDEDGLQLAYVASNDSADSGTRRSLLYYLPLGSTAGQLPTPRIAAEGIAEKWIVSQYSSPEFSHNGRRLIVGLSEYVAPDDTTIIDFEHPEVDVWCWDAPMTPPQEKAKKDKLKRRTLPAVVDLASMSIQFPTDTPLAEVAPSDRWDGDNLLIADPSAAYVSRQWDYLAPEMLSIYNLKSGTTKQLGLAEKENYMLSPMGKYVIKYENRNYHAYNTATGDSICLTSKIPYPIWEEDDDHPMPKQPYGIAAWTADDAAVLIYDKYDIWSVDPSGGSEPLCLTAGDGRKINRKYRYRKLDEEQRFVATGDLMVLDIFDYATKKRGYATMTLGKSQAPTVRLLDGAGFYQLKKAKEGDVFAWSRSNFEETPDIWTATSLDFGKAVKVTSSNPQKKDISWGTAQLVKWYAYDGTPLEGVLYLPEDYSESGSFPMLSVFYETGSEELYTHYAMEPSWSWINYPFYVSRGYAVFVPDIKYHPGLPGECAYNCVCSGVEHILDNFKGIDPKRVGIDGQSWGGYQTAYLVTRTNMFACAGSGAPVANMTSAFGGIRWTSGDSRQAQYEQGQSRIGRNLWDATELYIANSPVFHANRVETPLLIMHNDADGAVPWYQGIEMFMALRRLGKPVWMLQYNGEAHNLQQRKNCKDITHKLQEFFDHYLKGTEPPEWMKGGTPLSPKTTQR